MLGRVFNNRYSLKEKIGSGGMSDVYLADDLTLNRPVAVKILHPEFARDPSYIQRFRYEAQAAANLNHPNIVSVYDWGNEGDIYYIVMEYVEGSELKELQRAQGRLGPERAAEITAEIAAALQFAHRHNLVHRDIKPHNVIITPTGQVKVMDFGIARAATGTGMTQTGVVMGTAQYLSPEQAQGLPVDGRSDIYSLGIVLYEMLTGRVPFDDENPLTVAYRQVRDDPVPPSMLEPSIPTTMESIVMKSLAKNPANRYQTAQEMKADLLRFLEGIPVNATPIMPVAATAEPAMSVMPTTAIPVSARLPEEGARKTPTWVWVLVSVLGVLAVLGIILALVFAGSKPMVEVPNVVGMSQGDASRSLDAAGLKLEVKQEQYLTQEGQPADVIVSQDPEWGTRIAKNSSVSVVITRELRVPSLVGLSYNDAVSQLSSAGLKPDKKQRPTKKQEEVDKVLTQSPGSGTLITPGSAVTLEVGALLEKISVPNVKGKTAADAEAALTAKGLLVSTVQQPSETVKIGFVIDQSPTSGTSVYQGDTVNIYVSTGTEVPDVMGLKEIDAKSAITSKGLTVKVEYQSVADPTDPQLGRVVNENPPPGTMVEPGTQVTITVKKSP
jgi:beta-lactam-binding protein with PASTA domain/predicted Ser/Thr protein kinase